MDESVVPMRGQLVIVANRSGGMFSRPRMEGLDESIGESCYIIERPSGILLTVPLSIYHICRNVGLSKVRQAAAQLSAAPGTTPGPPSPT